MSLYDAPILAALEAGPKSLEELAAETRIPAGVVAIIVAKLQHAYRVYEVWESTTRKFQTTRPNDGEGR